jgi:hypothetical protein
MMKVRVIDDEPRDPSFVEWFAYSLFKEHGLDDWRFEFDRAKMRAGLCDYSIKTIFLSIHYMMNPKTLPWHVRDTLLHEVAHALTPGAGHGPVWKETALRIGCSGEIFTRHLVAEYPWTLECPCSRTKMLRHRLAAKFRDGLFFCKHCQERVSIFSNM